MSSSNSYKSILKGTSVFGGVQVVQAVINLLRGKFVALLLGPAGMGVSSLFNSSSQTLQRIFSLGLNLAVVKEVAGADRNSAEFDHAVGVSRMLFSVTAFIGAAVCAFSSPLLSRATFGDGSWTLQFVMLSAVVWFAVSGTGSLSLLQGMHEVKRIARSSLIGAITGLLVGIPLYWLFSVRGIVPAMIVLSGTLWASYTLSLKSALGRPAAKVEWKEAFPVAKTLVAAGVILMANEMLFSLVQYLVNVFIRMEGSKAEVGLYQAANSVTNQYAGMVFAAMAMDYFPRLSKAVSDNREMCGIVNRQIETVAVIICPAAILLILTAPLVIKALLTDDFLATLPLMRWMGLGIMLKALAYPLGYIAFAKGNKRLFFWMEGVGCNLLTLLLSCVGYRIWGLMGLGYAFVADNLLCLAVYGIVNGKLYSYRPSRGAVSLAGRCICMCSLVFAASCIRNDMASYGIMSVLMLVSVFFSWKTVKELLKKD